MRASLCFSLGAVLMFCAGWSFEPREYVASGTLQVSSENPEKQVCEIRIGNASDSRKKLLLVSTPDMAFASFCREHRGDRVLVTLRVSENFAPTHRQDGTP